ncbi:hypothetical protein BJX61DRAFT_506312 [Aspergillus egyptiacus]|nr:hypothetical protein BJX61DRAFT_506312 [Aspergillus egyptiacus]
MSSSGYSTPEDDDEVSDTPSIIPRSNRGTRGRALANLRSSLSQKSAETYSEFFKQQSQLGAQEETFNTTQDGIVIWTPQEKRTLYDVLDRKGKNGIRDIAAAIGSKSELEVQEYLRLLRKGVRKYHFNDRHSRTAILGEIPAAAEVSEECCEALDKYAEFLCLEEQSAEDIAGKRRHKSLWVIDEEVAEKLEAVATENQTHTDIRTAESDVVTRMDEVESDTRNDAAALFKLPNWILLSERLFMNFGGPRLEDNWVNIAFKNESPSMTADSLTDLYNIALNVTRRLVQATHFLASSRVRKNGTSSRPSAKVVRSSDVRDAAHLLNMECDSSKFWIGLARRCSLDVVDKRHRKGWNDVHLDHDEVEALLSRKSLPKEPYQRNSPSPTRRQRSNSVTSDMSINTSNEDPSADEDEHAEAVDKQNNALDELLCWTVLGQTPPESLHAQTSSEHIPPRPPGKRKTMEELVDWRDRTLYRNEWEEYGYEAERLDRAFEDQRKKRRLTASFRPLSTSRSKVRDTESSESEDQPKPDPHSGSEASDPEFRPGSPKRKSKAVALRASARKRMPVSYALQPIEDFDTEMDVDSEAEAVLTTTEALPRVGGKDQGEARAQETGSEDGFDSGDERRTESSRGDGRLSNPGSVSSSDADGEYDDRRSHL